MTDSPAATRQTLIAQLQAWFAAPPTLLAVAGQCAQAYLERLPNAPSVSAGMIYLATPTDSGGYRYQSLLDCLVQRLALGRPTLLVDGWHQVQHRTREVYAPMSLPLADLEKLINREGPVLLNAYARRLQAWWHAPYAGGASRWARLSDALLALLHDSPPPPGMSAAQLAQWLPPALLPRQRPDTQWRLDGSQLQVRTVHAGEQTLPMLLLSVPGQSASLLYCPDSGLHRLERLDDLGTLVPVYAGMQPEHWFVLAVQGDPLDVLAASYLARQLSDISAMAPGAYTAEQYQTRLTDITDPRRWFIARLTPFQRQLRHALPLWLAHASDADSLAYARLLRDLVVDAAQPDFLEGIAPLATFADTRLLACLKDEPRAAHLKPAAIRLTFNRVISAAVPVPGGFIAGEVQPITLSLTELAVENLAGLPHEPKRIALNGTPAPAWLTYDLLKGCVARADVGQAYPQLLKRLLIDDAAEARRRQDLFCRQLRVQLPMLALELKIRGERGLTQTGFDYVQAALRGGSAALWPLAFKATSRADADVAEGHFVIGPRDQPLQPHLLYQPLFDPPLREYPSLDGLFGAIKAPGPLQEQVLGWIAPARQAIYANGGFRQPHIRHFLPTDEFIRYEPPAPVQLSQHISAQGPAQQVFTGVARALVSLADRQTLSNAEQRWTSLKALGAMLFGTLLPFLRGPLLLGGWLVQLMGSAEADIQGLQSDDPQAQTAAILDVLTNLMVIVAHQAVPDDIRQPLDLEPPVFAVLAPGQARHLSPAVSGTTYITPPSVFEAPGRWANARDVITPALLARARALSLNAHTGGTGLANAESSGRWRGLLRVGEQWQALVRGQVYRVRLTHDQVRVISADGSALGPWLKALGDGRWDFDLQLRLRGGGDVDPQDTDALRSRLERDYQAAGRMRERANTAMVVAHGLLHRDTLPLDAEQRRTTEARYLEELQNKLSAVSIELQALKQLRLLGPRLDYADTLCTALETMILTARQLEASMRSQIEAVNRLMLPAFDALEADPGGADAEASHAQIAQGLLKLESLYDAVIQWRSLEQSNLNELQGVPRVGPGRAQRLQDEAPRRPSILEFQSLQMTSLWGIAIDVGGPPLDDDLFEEMNITIDRARQAMRSLADMWTVQTTSAQRIELLDNIDHVFARTDDRIEFWRGMHPGAFKLDYLLKLQQLLARLHEAVEQQLGLLLAPEPESEAVPPTPSNPPAAARRRKIIRTRNRDMYVAQISPEAGASGGETAEMRDGTGRLIGTYTEAEDGVWDLVSRSPTPRPDAELGQLINRGARQLRDVDRWVSNVETLVGSVNDPASLQEMLEAPARSLRWDAEAIARKLLNLDGGRLAATQQANARVREAELRAAAARLEAAGLDARIRATRQRPTTQDDVAFLHGQQQVRIVRQGPRVALRRRADDYLQVFRVDDVHTGRPLCYAHFHYARAQGPEDHFTAAHLKSPEQERLGREAQAQFEAQAFERIRSGQTGRTQQTLEIRRAQIQLAIARRVFFSQD